MDIRFPALNWAGLAILFLCVRDTPGGSMLKRVFLVYTLVVGISILAIVGMLQVGSSLLPKAAPPPVATQAGGVLEQIVAHAQHPLARLILQLVVIVVAARICGALAARLGQPPVIGEIAAGIFLGPSLLGWLAPGATAFLFPPVSVPTLALLFMFVVGIELDPALLRGKAHAAVAVSHVSIVFPFLLGVTLAIGLYEPYAPKNVPFPSFALFLGIAMSITAFPVLARMIEERGLSGTPMGTTAITCAAVDDVTAWSLLAFVVAFTTSGGAFETLSMTLLLSVVFVLAMIYLVRPLLTRLLDPEGPNSSSRGRMAVVIAVMLGSALATELIGIHALFGAFLAGVIMPSSGGFRRLLRERFETVSAVFLLPLFFAFTGLRTQIGLLDRLNPWLVCILIIFVATLGKLGGTVAAARLTGQSWRDSVTLGALMNTRGLMELVALNVGYELGILSPEIFAMMVLMALVTTAMTGPILTLTERVGSSVEEKEALVVGRA
jgi:Kef-type K+ transport system membrane component KefB